MSVISFLTCAYGADLAIQILLSLITGPAKTHQYENFTSAPDYSRTLPFFSLAVLDPRVDHTMDVFSSFISVLCHSDWLFHGESCPRLDVVHPGRAWSYSPACTWHCSLHYLFPAGSSLVHSWCDHSMIGSLLWQCLTVPSLLQLC